VLASFSGALLPALLLPRLPLLPRPLLRWKDGIIVYSTMVAAYFERQFCWSTDLQGPWANHLNISSNVASSLSGTSSDDGIWPCLAMLPLRGTNVAAAAFVASAASENRRK